jgi:hypothetical protein
VERGGRQDPSGACQPSLSPSSLDPTPPRTATPRMNTCRAPFYRKCARASQHLQTSKTTTHAVGRVHTATPYQCRSRTPTPSLLFALAHRAPPLAYKASTPLLLSFSFAQTTPPPPHSLTKRTQSKPAPLPSREGALRLPSNGEEGGNSDRFRPSLAAILSLPSPSF